MSETDLAQLGAEVAILQSMPPNEHVVRYIERFVDRENSRVRAPVGSGIAHARSCTSSWCALSLAAELTPAGASTELDELHSPRRYCPHGDLAGLITKLRRDK